MRSSIRTGGILLSEMKIAGKQSIALLSFVRIVRLGRLSVLCVRTSVSVA